MDNLSVIFLTVPLIPLLQLLFNVFSCCAALLMLRIVQATQLHPNCKHANEQLLFNEPMTAQQDDCNDDLSPMYSQRINFRKRQLP
ncbi:hypothetical protein PRIPAC_82045 [Pristionchus pacificus]|uniref:Uncharacterized protein n=1 Tax=Pristionchus pacificus TaxID=54126 RepID=A0A2A6C1Q9_PRIPA|nr:hypothetical protein PRIPAC_82045 [Pristionchus pacificus]|eukprot:PDM72104.1 hypothetical protein PRIPAC_38538 [Pristionchus pacificus]